MSQRDFFEFVRIAVLRMRSDGLREMEEYLEQSGGPEYWENDVRELIRTRRESLTTEGTVPVDLVEGRGYDAARALLQSLVAKFGLLMKTWPDIIEAARSLRHEGCWMAQEL